MLLRSNVTPICNIKQFAETVLDLCHMCSDRFREWPQIINSENYNRRAKKNTGTFNAFNTHSWRAGGLLCAPHV